VADTQTRTAQVISEREEFYRDLAGHGMAPLWETLQALMTRTPSTPAGVAKWDYDGVVRPFLMRAAKLITAKEAERRVLILENPGLIGKASITHSLYAGIQLLMPGEVAPMHRHSQSALRFIIEGNGAHTTVNGERTLMKPGDFVLTPSWKWHDHGNDTDEPMVWLDGLDIPLVGFFDASFTEAGSSDTQIVVKPLDDSTTKFGNNMLPLEWHSNDRHSPIINYPYDRSRETLHQLGLSGEPDRHHGFKVRFINPANGKAPLPTIGAFMQYLPAGFRGESYRSTDGTVLSVVEGEGESIIGGEVVHWKPRDVFVVPSWLPHAHFARTDAVLFSFSDRPAQLALGLWREERSDPVHFVKTDI
jgi:gentisate 1,2-dioxygenase